MRKGGCGGENTKESQGLWVGSGGGAEGEKKRGGGGRWRGGG